MKTRTTVDAYADWIDAHYPDAASAYGQCADATTQMGQAFPELRRVRGHYYCAAWGERSHWWLVTPAGAVVDPTARQFPSQGHGVYEAWTEGAKEPSGKCPNCGGLVFGSGTVCSDACAQEFVAYLQPEPRADARRR